ncbi:MAG TPA: Gfo/Idh/MocA family oxidoreductase, partial [Gemmatimonadaceae bacterium]|nr:Gfo/Idh/MocA family oxidoreductase [Gemmatimonadaceae bacterium]
MSDAPLRLGILGTARIASNFVDGLAGSTSVRIVAIASRDAARARAFAARHGVPGAEGSYQELLSRDDIDAVYIPLPNALHGPWAMRAMEAGRHVLCEKPLASNADEARAMFAAARRHGVHLAEAFPY